MTPSMEVVEARLEQTRSVHALCVGVVRQCHVDGSNPGVLEAANVPFGDLWCDEYLNPPRSGTVLNFEALRGSSGGPHRALRCCPNQGARLDLGRAAIQTGTRSSAEPHATSSSMAAGSSPSGVSRPTHVSLSYPTDDLRDAVCPDHLHPPAASRGTPKGKRGTASQMNLNRFCGTRPNVHVQLPASGSPQCRVGFNQLECVWLGGFVPPQHELFTGNAQSSQVNPRVEVSPKPNVIPLRSDVVDARVAAD